MSRKRGMVRARGLAAELKELREASGLSTREAADRVGVSAATINRIENAGRAVEPAEVSALLVVYGVTGNERVRIMELAREAEQRGKWIDSGSEYQGAPKQLTALVSFEAEATAITAMDLVIPGMLQTQEYARALLACFNMTERDIEHRIVIRVGRQVVLTRPRPPWYTAFIDEAALRRPIGGSWIMAQQLRHILRVVEERPNADVRVIPFHRGPHWGMISPFNLLEFAKADPIVHLEHIRSSALLDEPEDVVPYQTAKDKLAVAALGPAESADFLRRVAAEYDGA